MKRFLFFLSAIMETCNASLIVKWNFSMNGRYTDRMVYGSSPALSDFGPDVNSVGGERTDFLEIVVGSDEITSPYYVEYGVWRCIDALGNLEWYLLTLTDEARSSPAIDDFWGNNGFGDNLKDIAGGTTSGWNVETFSHTGNFFWRFGTMTGPGDFLWHSSPAIADVFPGTPGKEVIIGNSNYYCRGVFCLEGDIADNVDNGYLGYTEAVHPWCWDNPVGTDGIDWDLLWFYTTGGAVVSTPAVGDVDNDGVQEVIVGTGYDETPYWEPSGFLMYEGKIICLNGANGTLEWEIQTGGGFYSQVTASPALADVDGDGDLEIFVGAYDNLFYCINGDENSSGAIDPWEFATIFLGGPIYSSAAVGDVDGDGIKEIVVGGGDGRMYCLRYNPAGDNVVVEWQTSISPYIIFSSPALCAQNDSIPWLQFRHNARRTGHYPITGQLLHIFVGTWDGYLVHLLGNGTEVERIKLGEKIVTSPAIADIDKDCKLEVLIVTARGSFDSPGSTYSLDTLWCVGTDILSGIACLPSCDTFCLTNLCPSPCGITTSCEDQILRLLINNCSGPVNAYPDTTKINVTVRVNSALIGSGTIANRTWAGYRGNPADNNWPDTIIVSPPAGNYAHNADVEITVWSDSCPSVVLINTCSFRVDTMPPVLTSRYPPPDTTMRTVNITIWTAWNDDFSGVRSDSIWLAITVYNGGSIRLRDTVRSTTTNITFINGDSVVVCSHAADNVYLQPNCTCPPNSSTYCWWFRVILCDTFPTWIVCPYPCNMFTSCPNQVMIFGIGDDPADRVDTMRVYASYSITHSGGGILSGTLSEPTPYMSFQTFPPNSLYVTITPPIGTYSDGDVVQIRLDSLFSVSGCKTVP